VVELLLMNEDDDDGDGDDGSGLVVELRSTVDTNLPRLKSTSSVR